jgi:hypothetical protein
MIKRAPIPPPFSRKAGHDDLTRRQCYEAKLLLIT